MEVLGTGDPLDFYHRVSYLFPQTMVENVEQPVRTLLGSREGPFQGFRFAALPILPFPAADA